MVESVKILMVEDESIEAMDIKQTLESFGYEVPYVASSGEEAIKKALEIMPDLILMDIILKGETDGVEAASRIKSLDIPVIYLTAHSEESTIEKAKLTEPYGYIIKPYEHTELKYAIELALYKHKTEIKLKESEKQYRSILENIQDAYVRVNTDGRIIMVSPSAASMYGFDSPQEMIGIPAISLYKNPERRSIVLGDLKKEVQVGGFEGEALRKDGTSFWVSISIQFIYDDEGQIQGTEAFIRNITQRKKAENEIKKSENYYKAIFEHTGAATVIIEEDTTISLANAEFERLSGYPREEIQGKRSWTEFVVKEDLEKMKEYHRLRRINNRKAPTIYEFRFIDKSGDVKNIRLDIGMIPDTKKSVASLLDVTESKKSESRLLKSQEHLKKRDEEFRNFIDGAPAAIAMFDAQMRYIAASLRWIEDYTLQGQEIYGKSHYDIFPEITDELKNVHKRVLAGSILRSDDDEFLRADGTIQYIRWEARPWYSSSDEIGGIIIFSEDVTERKRLEKSLMERELNFRSLAENANYGIVVVTGEGHHLYANQEASEITGYTIKELLNTHIKDMVHPDTLDEITANIKRRIEGADAPSTYETLVLRKDKEVVPIEVSASKTTWKGQDADLVILRDISDRKKAEKSLKKSLERFRAVAESAVDAIVTTDSEGNIIFFNHSLTTIFGYSKDEITGEPLTILMPERFKKKYLEELRKYKKSGKHRLVGRTVSTNGLKKDGTEFPFEMSLSAWKSGEKTYFTSIIRDITKQKNDEEKMKDHLKKLSIINKVTNTANNAHNIHDLLKDILNSTLDLLGFESGGIYLLEEKTGFTKLAYYENLPGEFLEKVKRINVAVEPYFTVYVEKMPIYNYIEIKQEIETRYGFKSAAVIPLFSTGKVIGSLNVISKEKSFITDLEKDILESIGMQTGTVIARMYSEAAIKESLREKEALLTEIHHRVKNNMQIISSLLNLQSQYVEGDQMAADVLKESQNRVKSMAMVHEKLYQSDNLTEIKIDDYIKRLVSDLFYSYNILQDQINPVIDVEKIRFNMETAIPCGLIISELVTNSLKHAFPEKRKGEIRVSLKILNNKYVLVVSDDGVGLPNELDFKNTNTLGLQLVNSLVNQVDGEIELDKSHGAEFTIIFKESKYKERF